jgi:hypothetical protein
MNECCDWHAICLNEKEEYEGNIVYLSYCPECNSIYESHLGKVSKVDNEFREIFLKKYEEKIHFAKESKRK